MVLSKRRRTKRAVDLRESARFSSSFLASGFSCSQAFPQPARKPLTQTVRRLAKPIGKSDLYDKETLHEFKYSSNCRSVLRP